MPAFKDITGQRFGRFVAVKRLEKKTKNNGILWEFKCDCGNISITTANDKISGKSKSCRCLKKEQMSEMFATHGESKTQEYKTWNAMMQRCYNKNNPNFKHYGARGITVCDYWRESHKNFIKDMGPRPSKKHSIDRIDNDGNYEPSNCRWTNSTTQIRNQRSVRKNYSGYRGVCFNKKANKWYSVIYVNKVRKYLGIFANIEDAIAARKEAEIKYWGNNDKT